MGNDSSSLEGGGSDDMRIGMRVEHFEQMCLWKGRLIKSKIRRNWQSRLFFLCLNRQNGALFMAYFSDQGVVRHFIDLHKSFVTHDAARQVMLVSTLDDEASALDSNDDDDDGDGDGVDGDSMVWMLRYEDPAAFQLLLQRLAAINFHVGSVVLEGWLEKRSRKGTGPLKNWAALTILPARKRYTVLLECGDMLCFRDDQCQQLRGRYYLPYSSKIFCESDKVGRMGKCGLAGRCYLTVSVGGSGNTVGCLPALVLVLL
jgi:hypothetical protein